MTVKETRDYFVEMVEGLGSTELHPCGTDHMEMTKIALAALEKYNPIKPHIKKINWHTKEYCCPCCGQRFISKIEGFWVAGRRDNFCPNCGQAIDWLDHPTEKGGVE